jgi:hypothetical protein
MIYYKAVRERPALSNVEPVPAAPGWPKKIYWNIGYETTVGVIPRTKESIPYVERLLAMPGINRRPSSKLFEQSKQRHFGGFQFRLY